MNTEMIRIKLPEDVVSMIRRSYDSHMKLGDISECYMQPIKQFLNNEQHAWLCGIVDVDDVNKDSYVKNLYMSVVKGITLWILSNSQFDKSEGISTGADLILLGEILRILPPSPKNQVDAINTLAIPGQFGLIILNEMLRMLSGYLRVMCHNEDGISAIAKMVKDDGGCRSMALSVIETAHTITNPRIYVKLWSEGISDQDTKGLESLQSMAERAKKYYPCIDTFKLLGTTSTWVMFSGLLTPEILYTMKDDIVRSYHKEPHRILAILLMYNSLPALEDVKMLSLKMTLEDIEAITRIDGEFHWNCNFKELIEKEDTLFITEGKLDKSHPLYKIHVGILSVVAKMLETDYDFILIRDIMPWLKWMSVKPLLDELFGESLELETIK